MTSRMKTNKQKNRKTTKKHPLPPQKKHGGIWQDIGANKEIREQHGARNQIASINAPVLFLRSIGCVSLPILYTLQWQTNPASPDLLLDCFCFFLFFP